MIHANRGSLVFLPILMAGAFACAAPEPAAPPLEPGRLEYLESRLAGLVKGRAWAGGDYVPNGHVQSATVLGGDLLLEAWDSERCAFVAHCIDLASGMPRWQLVLGGNPLAVPPRGGDETVAFFPEREGSMIVCDRRNGSRLRERVRIDAIPAAAAATTGSTVFVPEMVTNRIVALDAETGTRGWHFRAAGTPVTSPVMSSRVLRPVVYFGTDNGIVYGLPAAGSSEVRPEAAIWDRKLFGPISQELALFEATTDRGHEITVYAACEDKGLYALDGATGTPRWTIWTDAPFAGPGRPAVSSGRVFGRNATRMVVIDQASGARLFAKGAATPQQPEKYFAPEGFELCDRLLAADKTRTYLLREGNVIVMIDSRNGQILAERQVPDFDFFLTNESSGTLIVGTKDGYVLAFE